MASSAHDVTKKYRNGELLTTVDKFVAGFKDNTPGPDNGPSPQEEYLQAKANERKAAAEEAALRERMAERARKRVGGV